MKRSFGSLESVPEAGEPAAVSQAPKLKRAQTENIVGSHRLSEVNRQFSAVYVSAESIRSDYSILACRWLQARMGY